MCVCARARMVCVCVLYACVCVCVRALLSFLLSGPDECQPYDGGPAPQRSLFHVVVVAVAEHFRVTQYTQQYIDKCIPQGEKTACVTAF